MGELPTPASGRGLIGMAAGKLQNWSLTMPSSWLGGEGQREDMMVAMNAMN